MDISGSVIGLDDDTVAVFVGGNTNSSGSLSASGFVDLFPLK